MPLLRKSIMNSFFFFKSYLRKQTFILKYIASLPLKSVFIFLFIVFLPIATGSQIQLSALSPTKIDLSQRTFGITFLSPSTILLLPLLFFTIKQFRNIRSLKPYTFEIFLFIFFIIAEISAIFGTNIQVSAIWLLKLTYGLFIYLIFSRLHLNKKQIRMIPYSFMLVIFIETLLSFMQYIKGGLLRLPIESISRFESTHLNVAGPFRVVGTFSGLNNLASYLALLIPIIVALLLSKNANKAYIYYAALVSCLTATFLSLSRWGAATIFFAIAFTAFFIKKYERIKPFSYFSLKKITKIGILVLVLVAVVIFSNPNIQNRFLNFSLNDKSLSIRVELVTQALNTIKDNAWLGVGGGNFVTYFANYDFTDNDVSQTFLAGVHNFYLLLASENGIAALLVFLFAMFMVIKFFFRKIRYLDHENKIITIGFFSAVITFFFNNLWVMRTFEDRISFLFWLILGLLINLLSRKSYQ